ncbi:MAG: ATP-binding cassette domain-containing protein [Maribacter sp.]|nr:ATP-binding cassette domain-containing protein [Maribacter sp.]
MGKKNLTETYSTIKADPQQVHWALFIDNTSNHSAFIENIFGNDVPKPFESFKGLQGGLFSKLALIKLIDEESRHGDSGITKGTDQLLQTMSSGEQKRILLNYLLQSKPQFLVLDNPFDNMDKEFQVQFKAQIKAIAEKVPIIQIVSRKGDLLPFIDNYAQLIGDEIMLLANPIESFPSKIKQSFKGNIPEPLKHISYHDEILIELQNVNVSYEDRPILKNISWKIKRGEFWELSGKNGSGKTTILSMITGENPKGYGQELYLFGRKKGTGESVWDIKKNIGYFTPSMTDKFTGYHSVENMMISGILDSVGLYVQPTEAQLRLAKQWLQLLNMWHLKDTLFHDLTMGQKRLVMTTRAMVKHPLLLILDEPTAGLDDRSASLLVSLVNKMARESNSTIIFVSHREEPNLQPQFKYRLEESKNGSLGKILAA